MSPAQSPAIASPITSWLPLSFPTPPRSPALHHASLLPASSHSPRLLELVQAPITRRAIQLFVQNTLEVVACWKQSTPHASHLASFVTGIINECQVSMATFVVALAYLERVKRRLSAFCAQPAHRLALVALMVASKYLNDSTLASVHWSRATGSAKPLFAPAELLKMELEFLFVLNFRTVIQEEHILPYHKLLVTLPSFFEVDARLLLPTYAGLPLQSPVRRRRAALRMTRSDSSSSLESEASLKTPHHLPSLLPLPTSYTRSRRLPTPKTDQYCSPIIRIERPSPLGSSRFREGSRSPKIKIEEYSPDIQLLEESHLGYHFSLPRRLAHAVCRDRVLHS